jgi:hypothetical protein
MDIQTFKYQYYYFETYAQLYNFVKNLQDYYFLRMLANRSKNKKIIDLYKTMVILNRHLILLMFTAFYGGIHAQDWEFSKERDGISIYTRHEGNSHYKSFKGEIELKADFNEVCNLIEDVETCDKWDEDIRETRILAKEKGKFIRYYVIYSVPWPFTDRDLCVEATISDDPNTGSRIFSAISTPDAVPRDPHLVRIIDYWQKWIIVPAGNGHVHVTMEGFADPAGDIPAWLANMAITDTPLNTLVEIRKITQK